jgi:hypothetical protein
MLNLPVAVKLEDPVSSFDFGNRPATDPLVLQPGIAHHQPAAKATPGRSTAQNLTCVIYACCYLPSFQAAYPFYIEYPIYNRHAWLLSWKFG